MGAPGHTRGPIPRSWVEGGKLIRAGDPGRELLVHVVPCPPGGEGAYLPASSCVERWESGHRIECRDCPLGPARGASGAWRGRDAAAVERARYQSAAKMREFYARRKAVATERARAPGANARKDRAPSVAGKARRPASAEGAWLRGIRTQMQLSQRAFGVLLGYAASGAACEVSKLETGRRVMSAEIRVRIERRLCASRAAGGG